MDNRLPPVPPTLIGTWITEDEDSDVAFTFSARNKKVHVSGFCRSSGEAFEIRKVSWDGKLLSFTARMPSTNTVTKNVFQVRRDGNLDLELTTYETWKKKEVKTGEAPESWLRTVRRPKTRARKQRREGPPFRAKQALP